MKLRKVKNTCLPIVSSVRLSYRRGIQKLRNKRNKLRNKRNKLRKRKNSDHAHRRLVKTHEVLKYDLTQTSLISSLDSYTDVSSVNPVRRNDWANTRNVSS